MKAVSYRQRLPLDHADSLLDVELPNPPAPTGRDLLVRVEAISVNPVDTKVRANADPKGADKVLGWDAAGTVVAVGPEARLFKVGDAVFYHYSCELKNRQRTGFLGGIARRPLPTRWKHSRLVATSRVT